MSEFPALISKSTDIGVLVYPHPLENTCRKCSVPSGHALTEILGEDISSVVVFSDGVIIEPDDWHIVIPKEQVIIRRVPEGNVGRLIGTIAILALSIYTGGVAAAAFGAGWGAAAAAGVSIVGNLALNALIPPPSLPGAGSAPGQLSFLTGSSNQVAPFAPIPVLYGRMQYYPPIPMTGLPYTELVGDQQYFRAMFVLGYGPLQIGGVSTASGVITQNTSLSGTPIKIGGTAISNFEDVEFQIGTPAQCTLFTNSIVENQVNVSVPRTGAAPGGDEVTVTDGDTYIRTTDPNTDEVSIDIYFPALFTLSENGNTRWARVLFQVHYRAAGSSDTWTALDTNWTIGSIERKPVRVGRRYSVPNGEWEIRLTRVSTFIGRRSTVVTDGTWTTLRSIKRNVRPFDLPNVVVMALRIRASDQLGGRLERLSIEATRILPVWNGSSWADQATRNPAWAYADVFSGVATRRPAPKARLDAAALLSWASWCDTEGLYCDVVLDSDGTTLQRGRDVAASGLGSWSVNDTGEISVVRDQEEDSEVLLSPRSFRDFSADYTYHEIPHALRVQFLDPDIWEMTERIVYADGYDESTATRFDTLSLASVTDPDQAWKMGRYHLAQLIMRPEQYSWSDDVRHLLHRRGQSIDLASDVIRVGLHWGRIKAVALVGGEVVSAQVDEVIRMTAGPDYGIRVQYKDGEIEAHPIATVTPGTTTITFLTPIPPRDYGSGDEPALAKGDQFLFGEVGRESIKVKLTRIEPRGDFKAAMTAVPAADDIFDAWEGDIPPFDPVITLPIQIDRLLPPAPTIVAVYTENVNPVDTTGALQLRLVIVFGMPAGLQGVTVEGRIRSVETIDTDDFESEWRPIGEVPSDAGIMLVYDVEEVINYEVQLRSRRGDQVSAWTTGVEHETPDLFQRIVIPSVSYNRQNIWREEGDEWTPPQTTVDGTVSFRRGGLDRATHTVRATLDTDDGTITVATEDETGEDTSISVSGNGTGSVVVTVTHDDSGVSAPLNFLSVRSGEDGAPGSPGSPGSPGADGADGALAWASADVQMGAFGDLTLTKNQVANGDADAGEIRVQGSTIFFRSGQVMTFSGPLALLTPYESTTRTASVFYVGVHRTTNANARFGTGFGAHPFYVSEYVPSTNVWNAIGNGNQVVPFTPSVDDCIIGIGSRPSTSDSGIRTLASFIANISLNASSAPVFFQSASITSALIQTLVADKIAAGSLTVVMNIAAGGRIDCGFVSINGTDGRIIIRDS